ncbi:MAG: hypothetical protein AAB573_02170 [Patescibacteria group bacterium]
MIRRKIFAGYFDDFVSARSLEKYDASFHRVLRKGIWPAEQSRFITYVLSQTSSKGKTHDDIVDDLADVLEDGIFCWKDYGVEKDVGDPEKAHLLCLGTKGKRMVKGNFIERWAYFLQYTYGEHSFIYGAILGGTILFILEITHQVLTKLFCLFLICS